MGGNENNMNQPIVSVVVPTKNRYEELYRAVRSVMIQSFEDWELILVIDSDDTQQYEKICNHLLAMGCEPQSGNMPDNRIYIFESKNLVKVIKKLTRNRGGASESRNLGIQASDGRYVCFLDSDDVWSPEKIQLQIEFMSQNSLWASHTDYYKLDERTCQLQIVSTKIMQGKTLARRIAYRSCLIATPTVMIDKSKYSNYQGLFPTELTLGEDLVAWLRISASNPIKFGHLGTPLTLVHIKSNSSRFKNLDSATFNFIAAEANRLGVKKLGPLRMGGLRRRISGALPDEFKNWIRPYLR